MSISRSGYLLMVSFVATADAAPHEKLHTMRFLFAVSVTAAPFKFVHRKGAVIQSDQQAPAILLALGICVFHAVVDGGEKAIKRLRR